MCGLFYFITFFSFGALGSLRVFGTIAIFCIRDFGFFCSEGLPAQKVKGSLLEDCSADGCRSIKRGLRVCSFLIFLYDTVNAREDFCDYGNKNDGGSNDPQLLFASVSWQIFMCRPMVL